MLTQVDFVITALVSAYHHNPTNHQIHLSSLGRGCNHFLTIPGLICKLELFLILSLTLSLAASTLVRLLSSLLLSSRTELIRRVVSALDRWVWLLWGLGLAMGLGM